MARLKIENSHENVSKLSAKSDSGCGGGLAREMLHEGILHEQRRLVGEKPDRGAGGREMLHEGILHEQRRLVGETTGS